MSQEKKDFKNKHFFDEERESERNKLPYISAMVYLIIGGLNINFVLSEKKILFNAIKKKRERIGINTQK